MTMTLTTLQLSRVAPTRRPRLPHLVSPGRLVQPLYRPHAARTRLRFRVASSSLEDHSGDGEPSSLPAQQQQQQQGGSERPRRERWMPASLLSGWKGTTSLMAVSAVGAGLLGSGFDLQGPESMLQALGVLALTVTVHEAGHFLAARTQNIHVTKFSVGFGPILWKWQGGEVEYSLRALPLGGFVAFPDDDPQSKFAPDDPDLLRNRPVKDRIAVVCAGVVANMIFAYLTCVTQANTVGVAEASYKPGVLVGVVNEGAAGQRAGLQRGDVLLEVGTLKVAPAPDSVQAVVRTISVNPKRELTFKVERAGEVLTIPVTPAEQPDGGGRIGVSLAPNAMINRAKASNPLEALALGAKELSELTKGVVKGLSQFFTNFQQSAEQVSGPVAILAVGAEVARRDISGLYQFAALVNINLAVVNILPLPALDGGYLVFLVLEALRGKKVNENLEKGIMASGLVLLMTLGVVLIVRDTLSLAGIAL